MYKRQDHVKENILLIEEWFTHCGVVINTKSEAEFDELMLFSGSGPGYIFYIAECYYQKMIHLGHNQLTARKLINQLFLGSSKLMQQSDDDLSTLCRNVTSKGGVTQAALEYLDKACLPDTISGSIDNAISRSKQLARL